MGQRPLSWPRTRPDPPSLFPLLLALSEVTVGGHGGQVLRCRVYGLFPWQPATGRVRYGQGSGPSRALVAGGAVAHRWVPFEPFVLVCAGQACVLHAVEGWRTGPVPSPLPASPAPAGTAPSSLSRPLLLLRRPPTCALSSDLLCPGDPGAAPFLGGCVFLWAGGQAPGDRVLRPCCLCVCPACRPFGASIVHLQNGRAPRPSLAAGEGSPLCLPDGLLQRRGLWSEPPRVPCLGWQRAAYGGPGVQ